MLNFAAGYYSPIFTNLQQKDKSGFLTYLWSTDPFKAKWTILAKAYSVIRDKVGKQGAPLDNFLAINGPFIGIVAAEDYLVMLGWEIGTDEEGQINLRRGQEIDLASIDYDLLTTNLSVQDIIQHSYKWGYFMDVEAGPLVDRVQPAMMMATGAQTVINSVHSSEHFLANISPEQGLVDEDGNQVHYVGEEVRTTETIEPHLPIESSTEDVESTNQAVNVTMTSSSTEINEQAEVDLATAASQSMDPMSMNWVQDQNQTLGDEPFFAPVNPVLALGNEYFSLNEGDEFNTELDFNPYMGSSFNAFDLSHFAYEDFVNELDPFFNEF